MLDKKYNEKAINDVYKNAHLALQSISDIKSDVNDFELKAELQQEYEGYQNILTEVEGYMKSQGLMPKDANFFQKAMMKSAIKMKTMMNNSKNQIAEMMLKGTVNGINELTAMKNESENLSAQVYEFVDKLLSLELEYEQRLRKFL